MSGDQTTACEAYEAAVKEAADDIQYHLEQAANRTQYGEALSDGRKPSFDRFNTARIYGGEHVFQAAPSNPRLVQEMLDEIRGIYNLEAFKFAYQNHDPREPVSSLIPDAVGAVRDALIQEGGCGKSY